MSWCGPKTSSLDPSFVTSFTKTIVYLFALTNFLNSFLEAALSTFPLSVLSLSLKNFCVHTVEVVLIRSPPADILPRTMMTFVLVLQDLLAAFDTLTTFSLTGHWLLQAIVMQDLSDCFLAWSPFLISLFYWLILLNQTSNQGEALLFFTDTFTLVYDSEYHPSPDDP